MMPSKYGNGSTVNGKMRNPNQEPNASRHTAPSLSNGKSHNVSSPPDSISHRLFHQTLFPILLIGFTPNLVIVLWYTANFCDGSFQCIGNLFKQHGIVQALFVIWKNVNIFNKDIILMISGYVLFAALLQLAIPGRRTTGPITPKGHIPVYKDNGFYCYVITIVAFVLLTCIGRVYGCTPTIIYDNFGDMLAILTIFSIIFCAFLYLKGLFWPSSKDSGSSGNPIFDYYWGTELYPRVLGIDIKVFTNCRFGMTVWPLLCLIFALKSYELYGFVDNMWVSCILQMMYFTKFFWWESGYMHTIDIMVDRAGYYICWGCLVFVPGLYASVSLYLVSQPIQIGMFYSLSILLIGVMSILLNYAADAQKQEVRKTNGRCKIWGEKPDLIRATYQVEGGKEHTSLLLVSGFWGISRHFHYIPEIVLALAWTIPVGFRHIMPYSYIIFLTLLLIHRSYRDDIKCSQKYGRYWKKYCQKVPYKVIPGLF